MNRSQVLLLALTAGAGTLLVAAQANPALAGDALTPSATVAEYDGEIRRYTVKLRRKSDDYRLRVITVSDDESGTEVAASAVHAELIPTGEGPAVDVALRRGPQRAQVRFGVKSEEYSMGAKSAWLEFQIPEKVVMEKDEYFADLTPGGGWVEVVHDTGLKARLRQSVAGDLTVVVMNEDRDWDPSELTGVTVGSVDADGITANAELAYEQTRHAWIFDVDAGDFDPTSYGYRSELAFVASDGTVLDSLQDSIVVDDDTVDPGISTIRISETKKGVARLVTWTWSAASEGATLESALSDSATGEDLIMTVDDSPVEVLRNFSGDFAFDKPPEGYGYGVSITLQDAEGQGVASYETKLDVPKLGEDSEEITGILFAEEEALIAIVPSDENLYTVHLQYAGEDVGKIAGAEVKLAPSSDGPVPKESSARLVMDEEWRKWVQKGAGALTDGAYAELSLVLTDAEGEVLDEIHTSANAGRAYDDGTGPDEVDVFIEALAGGNGGTTRAAHRRIRIRR